LAQRSAEAAKEIKTLISASSAHVEQGVDLVAETGKALERIVTHIAEMNGIVSEIAASAQEQATGLGEVNTAINQMDQATQQNAAMVEQSTASTRALTQETAELSRLIGQFRLGQEPRGAAQTSNPKVTRPIGSSSKPSAPALAMKTTGRRGAVRAAVPQLEEDWQEF
jgi:methyl-accepting chemotaxis protein